MPFAFEDNPDYQGLPETEKTRVRQRFFERSISTSPDFKALPIEEQARVRGALRIDAEPTTPATTVTTKPTEDIGGLIAQRFKLPQLAAAAAPIAAALEPLRTPTVGLGGLAAGAKALAAGEPVLPAAAKSIKEQKGLGRELVAPIAPPGIPGEIATVAAEIATDPLTYIPLTAFSRVKRLGGLSPAADEALAGLERAGTAGIPPSTGPVPAAVEGLAFKTRAPTPAPAPTPAAPTLAPVPTPAAPTLAPVPTPAAPTPSPTTMEGRTLFLRAAVSRASQKVADVAAKAEQINERVATILREAGTIQETGTLPKEVREAFRKGGVAGGATEADIRGHAVSFRAIKETESAMLNAAEEFKRLKDQVSQFGDPESVGKAAFLYENYRAALKKLTAYGEQYNLERFAVNRAIGAYQTPVPREILDTLKEAGVLVNGMKEVKARLPITENIIHSLRRWKELKPGEVRQLGSDVVDQFRLNLFSPFSFSLDLLTNAAELGTRTISSLSHDAAYMARTQTASMPASRGMIDAVRRPRGARVPQAVEAAFDATVSGEKVAAPATGQIGAFYMRRGPVSMFYDYLIGAPLYAKSAVDSAAKRLGAMSQLYREAYMAADSAALVGRARQEFVDRFIASDAPQEAIQRAIAAGQKAGFSRELTRIEEKIAGSKTVQLLLDSFPRWGFQFTRWSGEMLGANPALLKRLAAGAAKPEEVAEYLARTATGVGGLVLIDKMYDRVDFRSMEYVKPNGNRVRLSGREPLASGLFLLSVVKGDTDNALASLKFASLPGVKALSGDGGLLTWVTRSAQRAAESKEVNPRQVRDELTGVLNRAIPGQALLGAMKTVLDPVIREGVGAGLPGVSKMLPAAIDPATGKPLTPRIRVPGTSVELPSVMGTPIPGAERMLDPVGQVLSKYGRKLYRGPGTSILATPQKDIPDEYLREWTQYLGESRQQVMGSVAARPEFLDQMGRRAAEKYVAALDSAAGKMATARLLQAHPDIAPAAAQRRVAPPETARQRGQPAVYSQGRP